MTTDNRKPDEIERDLETTRARMDQNLIDLEQKLSPGQLVDQAMSYLRDGGYGNNVRSFGNNLGRQVRDNPMPVALVGIGLAWLAMGQRNGRGTDYDELGVPRSAYNPGTGTYAAGSDDEMNVQLRARTAADDIKRRTDETTEAFERRRQQAMAKVLDVKEQSGESAAAFKARIDESMERAGARYRSWQADMQRRGRDAGHYARDRWDRSSRHARDFGDTAARLFQEQPLLGAAAGVTIGALLGSLIPPSDSEDELMGHYRDDALDRGRHEATRVAEDAADVASRAGEEAYDAARRETGRT